MFSTVDPIEIGSGSIISSLNTETHPVDKSLTVTEYVLAVKFVKSSGSYASPTPSLSQSTVYELVPVIVKSIAHLYFHYSQYWLQQLLMLVHLHNNGKTSLLVQLLSSVTVT